MKKFVLFSVGLVMVLFAACNFGGASKKPPSATLSPTIAALDTPVPSATQDETPSPTQGATISAKTVYVAPVVENGDGSKDHPYQSLQLALMDLMPGDTLYLRGGTYYMMDPIAIQGTDGTKEKPIRVMGYPGEKAVLSFVGVQIPNDWFYSAISVKSNYWVFKDFDIENVPSKYRRPPEQSTYQVTALSFDNCRGCVAENLTVSHIQGGGIVVGFKATENLIQNCDVFDCHDLYSPEAFGPGGNANCITVIGTEVGTTNRLVGCRVWYASDDGFDLWGSAGEVIFEDCAAYFSGFDYETKERLGNGQGFKLGKGEKGPPRKLIRCIAAFNKNNGFDDNGTQSQCLFENCIAYGNGDAGFAVGRAESVTFYNCALYGYNSIHRPSTQEGNSWQIPNLVVDAGSFESVDFTLAIAPRNADFSLPQNAFLRPKKDSGLINAGSTRVPVGLTLPTYKGKAPDIGPFEVG